MANGNVKTESREQARAEKKFTFTMPSGSRFKRTNAVKA